MKTDAWVAGQNPQVNDNGGAADLPQDAERKFFGHELAGMMQHVSKTLTGRPLKGEELPYAMFFYRWSEFLGNLFNDHEKIRVLMKIKEDEIKTLGKQISDFRNEIEALKAKVKPLQTQNNDQAQKIVDLTENSRKAVAQSENLFKVQKEKFDRDLQGVKVALDNAEKLLLDIAAYDKKSIKALKLLVTEYFDAKGTKPDNKTKDKADDKERRFEGSFD